MTRKKVVEILRRELVFLSNHFNVKKIGLFGSLTRRGSVKVNDIDMVVELSEPIGFKFFDLIDYLEKTLGKKVDIITSDGLKAIRIKEVARDIKRSLFYV